MINRFEWLKAVLQADVPDRGKALAAALAVEFANDETGQTNPSLDTLATYLRTSVDTVRRACADLCEGGWLAREVGRGRGRKSGYVLLSPGSVVAFKAAPKVAAAPLKRSQPCKVSAGGKGSKPAAKRLQDCKPHIRQEQSSEQRAGARPAAHLSCKVESGGWKALEWNKWLSDQGLRTDLASLKALHMEGGYDLPFATPPRPHHQTEHRIALEVIKWAMGARDAAAA